MGKDSPGLAVYHLSNPPFSPSGVCVSYVYSSSTRINSGGDFFCIFVIQTLSTERYSQSNLAEIHCIAFTPTPLANSCQSVYVR